MGKKVLVCAVLLGVGLWTGACGDGSSQTSSGGTAACPANLLDCSGTCVDADHDPANCGACGTTCGASEVCAAGKCAVSCGPGATQCNGTCVDINIDPANCGFCGTACAEGQVCSAGKCSAQCGTGTSDCSGGCVDLDVDPANCGACGMACPGGEFCAAGQCSGLICGPGTTACANTCVDTNVDPANCGACGMACPIGETCAAGQCSGFVCGPGTIACSDICVDPDVDPANCGACGKACAVGEVCVSGMCSLSCQPGLLLCDGLCTNPLTSDQHCGASGDCTGGAAGEVCPSGFVCNGAGVCALSCQAGLMVCNNVCTDTQSSNVNCGACDVVCGAGQACVAGQCSTTCQSGQIICNGNCIDPQSNPLYCGASGDCLGANDGTACAANEACSMGSCKKLAAPTSILVNERNASKQHIWDFKTNTLTLFHSVLANDADCNASQGSPLVWFVEHGGDKLGNYNYGSASGFNVQYGTPYAYPKHVTVFGNSIIVMSRNDGTLKRYNASGVETQSVTTGITTGQGMATDGTSLFVSVWNGAASVIQRYNATLVLQQTFANPTGLAENNVVDLVYDPNTTHFLGLVTTGEGGTTTTSSKIVEFVMGGAVVQSFTLPISMDGIGMNACP